MKLALGFIFLSVICFGFEYKIKELKDKEDKFPYIISEHSPQIAEKINTFLHLHYLDMSPGAYDYNISNTLSILTVTIFGEGCGAYCERFTNYHNFRLDNGGDIEAKELFTESGKNEVEEILKEKLQYQINGFLKSIKNNNDETSTEQRELYTNCLKKDSLGELSEYSQFTISHKNITFYEECCSNHAMRALDDLAPMSNTLIYQELYPYMNDFGKSILDTKISKIK